MQTQETTYAMTRKTDLPRCAFLACAVVTGVLVLFLFGYIFWTAIPVFCLEGPDFLFGTVWNYELNQYGIFFFIAGTVLVTVLTLLLAIPLGLLTAIYLAEFAPAPVEKILRPLIELLVGIPSIVYGIFGFLFLRYFFRDTVDPFLDQIFGFIPFMKNIDPSNGNSILLGAVILTIMVIPTIIALSQDAMRAVPPDYREASLALGATRWETVTRVIIPAAWSGIVTSIVLAMMRAMGETMAVVMVVGNSAQIPSSVLGPAYPMTSKILNDIGYWVSDPMGKSALFGIAAVLFVIEIVFVAVARWISSYGERLMR